MQLSPISWQDLSIEYEFKPQCHAVNFFDFQPNAKCAIKQFNRADFGSALILKSESFPEYLSEIEIQFDTQKVVYQTEFNRQSLFDYAVYLDKQDRIEIVKGAISKAHQGILILNLNSLLLDLSQWHKLKHALLFGQYQPAAENPIPRPLERASAQFKLLLIGNRDEIATLFNYDETLYQFCQYAEIENYLTLDEKNIQQWADYIQTQAQKYINKSFNAMGLNQFLRQAMRESENQNLISISPTLLKKQLLGLHHFYPNQAELNDIQGYFEYQEKQSAILSGFILQDMLHHQVYIETDGEEIGQINGLSVIEFDGVPQAFGEPIRISCNIQYGDGEIHDIERKVELGGNLHSKGILLAESCLSNLLEFPTQLPFSASLAFEQSYGEIDGDSSALAIFCVLVSALAKQPLPQSLAVTGAIDQFGNVLSVGGANQKIEGFFNLCQARGLTGQQGVIIPSACLSHLSLNPNVMSAIQAKQFHIWAVNDVFEALNILLDRPFFDEDCDESCDKASIFTLIYKGIQSEETRGSFWQKLCKKFFH